MSQLMIIFTVDRLSIFVHQQARNLINYVCVFFFMHFYD